MLSAFISVKPLGNDFLNYIYSGGRWRDFNKCLVNGSNHPINETNPFSRGAFKKMLFCYNCVFRSDRLQSRAQGVKICATWECVPQEKE